VHWAALDRIRPQGGRLRPRNFDVRASKSQFAESGAVQNGVNRPDSAQNPHGIELAAVMGMARRLTALLLALLAMSATGQTQQAPMPDVSGNWTGSITIPQSGRRGEKNELTAVLRQNGPELTGAIGPNAQAQLPISKGRVEATKFGTVITFDLPGPSFVMHFELRAANGVLRGHARLDGERVPAPVELLPVK
jgi:hypothetical protein